MMAMEIKFRARHTKTGKWWYGSSEQTYSTVKAQEKPYDLIYTYALAEFWSFVRKGILDSKTVGQYTGLSDKNGKEIYKGDIVDFIGTNMTIVWYESAAGWAMQMRINVEPFIFDIYHASNSEIIGNIYENPELVA